MHSCSYFHICAPFFAMFRFVHHSAALRCSLSFIPRGREHCKHAECYCSCLSVKHVVYKFRMLCTTCTDSLLQSNSVAFYFDNFFFFPHWSCLVVLLCQTTQRVQIFIANPSLCGICEVDIASFGTVGILTDRVINVGSASFAPR